MSIHFFKFSILIPVHYNAQADHFNLAIKSIWDDQILKPNQIIIVCDGVLYSNLYSIITSWQERLGDLVFVLQLKTNIGLALALNEGLKYCKYDYVARMDSDDISTPNRFLNQFTYLSKNPNTSLIGSNVLEFKNDIKNIIYKKYVPCNYNDISKFIKYRNPINHMTVVFKKSDILKVGGYTAINGYEDYLLWVNLFVNGFILDNLKENLVFARIDNGFISRRKGFIFFKNEIKLQFIFYKLGLFGIHFLFFNLLFRAISRLLPTFILNILYKKLRNE